MIFNETKFNKDWRLKNLNNLGDFNRGKSKHRPRNDKKLFIDGKYPLIQTGDVTKANLFIKKHTQNYNDFGLQQSKIWKKNTLCITIAANIAETSILSYPACFPDSVVGFVANKEETSELFMHYIFSFIRNSIQGSVKGSVQDNINIEYLSELKFRIPSKEDQIKITNVLTQIDNLIDTKIEITEKIFDFLGNIYDFWFIQFKEGLKKNNNLKRKLVWNKTLEKKIPENWKVHKINQFLKILSGYSFKSKDYEKTNGKYKIITIKNVQENNLTTTDVDTINYLPKKIKGHIKLKRGDILISLTGNVGRIATVHSDNLLLNQRVGKFETQKKLLYYFLFFFKRKENKTRLINIANGSAQDNLSPIDMTDDYFLLPDDNILEKFNKFCIPLMETHIENSNQIEELTRLKNTLLPMLITGQLKV